MKQLQASGGGGAAGMQLKVDTARDEVEDAVTKVEQIRVSKQLINHSYRLCMVSKNGDRHSCKRSHKE